MTGDNSFAESLRSVGAGEDCVSPPLASREAENWKYVSSCGGVRGQRVNPRGFIWVEPRKTAFVPYGTGAFLFVAKGAPQVCFAERMETWSALF